MTVKSSSLRTKEFSSLQDRSESIQLGSVFLSVVSSIFASPSILEKMKTNKLVPLILIITLSVLLAGCSNGGAPILPKGELTPEQLEKIKKEDRAIEQEESQGSIKN
jgi:hypothetical protein